LTLPGYPYPVTENPSSGTLFGKGLFQGHQSHYVLTKPNGEPITEICEIFYDELVLDQEGQVLPIFVVELEPIKVDRLQQRFLRQVHTPSIEFEHFRGTVSEEPTVKTGLLKETGGDTDESDYNRW